MKRNLTGLSLVALLATGCAHPLHSPLIGGAFTGVQGHQSATANPIGSKRGESCAMSILGLAAFGDASAAAAAQAGGITKVGLVDSDMFGVLGIFAKHCTVVRGE